MALHLGALHLHLLPQPLGPAALLPLPAARLLHRPLRHQPLLLQHAHLHTTCLAAESHPPVGASEGSPDWSVRGLDGVGFQCVCQSCLVYCAHVQGVCDAGACIPSNSLTHAQGSERATDMISLSLRRALPSCGSVCSKTACLQVCGRAVLPMQHVCRTLAMAKTLGACRTSSSTILHMEISQHTVPREVFCSNANSSDPSLLCQAILFQAKPCM